MELGLGTIIIVFLASKQSHYETIARKEGKEQQIGCPTDRPIEQTKKEKTDETE